MRESIHDLLRNFRGLEPLKRMFWQELNYDRVNRAVSTREWGDAERQMISGEPLLLAEHGEFKVLYLRMRAGLARDDQRALINRMLQVFPYVLFVFSDSAQQHWHFINVKYERDPKRRRVFRRITVLAGSDQLRTATERLAMLDLETVSRDLFGIPPLAIQQRHDQAFDVEAVTREFFREYDKIFKQAEAHLTALPEERRRLFTQKLFNRLMFIVFLERKGWLTFNGSTKYLQALWEDYMKMGQATGETNFYWNRLYLLFFSGLNSPQNLTQINRGGYIAEKIGHVPYLNGGLFDGDDDDENRAMVIPDEIFKTAITDLFYRFNFTIAESTPLDIEVAVDPEMLGKIFEELVTGRHESGSYYTPKPVVSFMCREGLKGYLRAQLPSEKEQMIARFVDGYDASQLRDPEAALRALQLVTVCDPACGSGAYLLGMMQELILLRQALFTARNVDARSMYDRKLEIIQNNIYGVDKDPFATNIAQLRLWLSLIVDFERGREGAEPPMLPNLDYKIEQGDSLLAPDPSGGLQLDMFRQQQVTDYSAAKKHYLSAHGEEKLRLRREVERLRAEIRQWARGAEAAEAAVVFDWAVDFVEVFDDGGFDIVLANPPYVRQEQIKDKPALRQVYGTFYSGTADLYTYFYARAVQMLKSNGMLVFISSNKWLRADYGTNLRTLLAADTRLETVIDFGDLPVFGAIAYPVIIVAQRQPPTRADVRVLTPKNLDRLDDLREHVNEDAIDVAPASLRSGGWSFGDAAAQQRMETMRAAGIPLGKYVKSKIYRGLLTGLNEAFVINGATRAALIAEDANSEEVIKQLATGKDIRKWTITDKDKWLIVTPIGIDIKRYPAIFDYLQQWQSALEKRGDKGKYWWELRACDYYDAFEKPKIMFPDIAKDLRFSLDRAKLYGNNTMYFIPVDDLYLLGLLNSSIVEIFYKQLSTQIQGGYIRMFRQYVEQIPVPVALAADRTTIADLAQKCLDKHGIGCEVEEAEINERVARLYGLKSHEVQQ